ncbi:cation diffusion facilitator family transporter [Pyrobaculum aerophilum]|uniref:Cation transporter n=1 Tax=Pyrobaculum aerophilum TaxID=13773 RepID=A0A371R643_9CREN|nr:cation diffusion facilitator family transporter [Pyrobaculum aerophilum]RFA97720.1 cation transporter [Pyrobaculum aerophilum]RFA99536.1 cation transporter [Pyrobaculum aerophilum]
MDKLRAAFTSLVAGIAVTLLKIVAWSQSFSVAVLADAVHSAVDLLAVTITYIAVKASLKPPDREHPYGHHKAETLGGIGGSLAVMASGAFISYEAVMKLIHWEPFAPTALGIAIVALAIIIDFNRVLVLRRFRGVSRALEADALHFSTDLASSSAILAVLIFGAFSAVYAPNLLMQWGPLIDASIAFAITIYFVKLSMELLRASVVELLDYAPPDIVERTKAKAGSVAGVQSVRAVKVRKSGSVYHADVTITVDENLTVKEAHEIADKVEKTLREVLGGEVTVHVEPHKPTAKPVEKTPPSSASRSPPEPSEPPSRSPQ